MASRQPQESLAVAQAPPLGLAALVVANALLAVGPLFVRMSDTGPIASGFWRMALALPVLVVLARVVPVRSARITGPAVFIFMLSGLLFAADIAAWHLGIVRTKMANATLFGNCASLIYPIYGFVVARAWPGRSQGAALVIAGLGAALLLGRSAELSSAHFVGDLLSVLAGVFYAGYFVLIAHARATLAPMPLLAASTLASAVPLLAMALWAGETIVPAQWTPLVLLALGSQVAGQGLMVYALGRMPPLVVGLALLTQPVVAAAIGWVVFGERLGALDLVGAALIAAALVMVRAAPGPSPART